MEKLKGIVQTSTLSIDDSNRARASNTDIQESQLGFALTRFITFMVMYIPYSIVISNGDQSKIGLISFIKKCSRLWIMDKTSR